MADETLDFAEDYEVPLGTDFAWVYEWQPLNLTGATAQFIADFGTFACTVTVTQSGDDSVSQVSVTIPNATTSTLTKGGLYNWQMQVTVPGVPSNITRMGHGMILMV